MTYYVSDLLLPCFELIKGRGRKIIRISTAQATRGIRVYYMTCDKGDETLVAKKPGKAGHQSSDRQCPIEDLLSGLTLSAI